MLKRRFGGQRCGFSTFGILRFFQSLKKRIHEVLYSGEAGLSSAYVPAHPVRNNDKESLSPVLVAVNDAERIRILLLIATTEGLSPGKIAVELKRLRQQGSFF